MYEKLSFMMQIKKELCGYYLKIKENKLVLELMKKMKPILKTNNC